MLLAYLYRCCRRRHGARRRVVPPGRIRQFGLDAGIPERRRAGRKAPQHVPGFVRDFGHCAHHGQLRRAISSPEPSSSTPPSGGSTTCSMTAARCATASASAASASPGRACKTVTAEEGMAGLDAAAADAASGSPDLPRHMAGGVDNPLGARAMYLGSTLYRIHGSNEPETIGQAVSSGCFRMTNDDVDGSLRAGRGSAPR